MERFDVTASGQRLGLEDMAVLMGKSPSEKYNGSLENIAKAVDLFCDQTLWKARRGSLSTLPSQ